MPANTSRSAASSRATRGPPQRVDDIIYSHNKKLSIPSLVPHDHPDARNEERLERNAAKWSTLFHDATYLLYSHYSVCAALGGDTDASVSDPERLVSAMLTPNESSLFKEWKRDPKRALPDVSDWRALRTPINASTNVQAARWEELTAALRMLYNKPNISPESCKGWVEKYKKIMPLLIAAKKIEQARYDARAGERGGSARRHVHELIQCRRLVNEMGKYRIEMHAGLRDFNRATGGREGDLVKRLQRLEDERPRKPEAAREVFLDRESYWKKLTRTKMERLDRQARAQRQNAEMAALEKVIKARMDGLGERLRSERRKVRS